MSGSRTRVFVQKLLERARLIACGSIGWLWANRQWVFSGIGVVIGAAILGWVLSPSPPPKPATEIKAVGGVAAGGDIHGNTITINGSPDTPPKDNPPPER
ncbi:MAG: hypothetical protein P9E88_02880 [Candidatus Competibacter sp.]|jgi:hypothetical protein|nr:hypothetical protein [Candidatus Competibacter sp.]